MTHISFTSDDLDADYARLVAVGRTSVSPPRDDRGRGRHAFFTDPNGVLVEIAERSGSPRIAVVEHDIVKQFDHYSVYANDLVGAEKFYGDELGMEKISEVTDGSTFTYYAHDCDVLQLVKRPKHVERIYDHFAFRVENIPETVKYMSSLGHTALDVSPPLGDAYHAGAGALYVDPDGIEVEFLDRPDVRQLGFGPFN